MSLEETLKQKPMKMITLLSVIFSFFGFGCDYYNQYNTGPQKPITINGVPAIEDSRYYFESYILIDIDEETYPSADASGTVYVNGVPYTGVPIYFYLGPGQAALDKLQKYYDNYNNANYDGWTFYYSGTVFADDDGKFKVTEVNPPTVSK